MSKCIYFDTKVLENNENVLIILSYTILDEMWVELYLIYCTCNAEKSIVFLNGSLAFF